MDLHVIIVITCVFLASLFSILFINKFFKSKTYEEAAAEKKALVEKLYPSTNKVYNKKQTRKQVTTKKDKKRQQKQQQQQHQQQRETTENDSNDSDNQSVDTKSIESSPAHSITKKLHVEFSEPEIIETLIDDNQQKHPQRRTSDTKINSTINVGNNKQHQQQKRKIITSKQNNSGILMNKTETVIIKEQLPILENLNHFDIKHPKDVIELKKMNQQQSDSDITKQSNSNKNLHNQNTNNNNNVKKSNKSQPKILNSIITNGIDDLLITNDIDEKQLIIPLGKSTALINTDSPKSNKSKNNTKNKKDKELLLLMEKINCGIGGGGGLSSDVIGVNCIMSIVSQAELNRNDIQILIDYLLNKQQDTITVTHSEWSDDIVQKLRKQLNEKEKQLQEEQESSIGLQAKLRDLRTEINAERANINSTNKAYLDEILSKKTEIINLNQDIQNLNDKLLLERTQFQAKLRHEKQTNSQELLTQIQQLNERNNLLQTELHQKTTIINELQILANTSHQSIDDNNKKYAELNEICKQHVDKIIYLEQCLNDTEKNHMNVRQQYDLEMVKIVENEKDLNKVEIRNLQNALDSTKAELNLVKNELMDIKQNYNILSNELNEKKIQFGTINNQCQEQNKITNDLKISLADMKRIIDEKDKNITEYEITLKQLTTQNNDLMKAIKEQQDKNNVQSDPINDEQNIRNLLQRLYPNELKKITELTVDEFVDYINIIQNHNNTTVKIESATSLHKTSSPTNLTSENYNLNNHKTSHNHNNIKTNKIDINNTNKIDNINTSSNSNINSNTSSSSTNNSESQSLLLQNAQLRTHIDELTKIVTKTENMLINLETQARDQDAHWRSVVQSKQEEINILKTTNGDDNI